MGHNDQKRDNIEVRLNKDGSVDEIVICDPHDGRCLFHLEQMDTHYYWMRAYGITQDLVAHIGAMMGKRRGGPILGGEVASGEGVVCLGPGVYKKIAGWQEIEAPVVNSDFEWEDSYHEDKHTPVEHRTPEEVRHAKVLELFERFNVDQVLNDLMMVYAKGRKDPHDLTLVEEVQQARVKFAEADKAAWDKKMQEGKKV